MTRSVVKTSMELPAGLHAQAVATGLSYPQLIRLGVQAHGEGARVPGLAEQPGPAVLAAGVIARALEESGLLAAPEGWDAPRRILSPDDEVLLRELKAQGVANAEIARRLRVSRQTVQRHLGKAG